VAKELASSALRELFVQHDLGPADSDRPAPLSAELRALDEGQELLLEDDPGLIEGLRELTADPPTNWLASLRSRLCETFAGANWVLLAADRDELAALALRLAEEQGSSAALELDALDYRSRREDLWEAVASAGAANRRSLVREERSAFRLAAGAWSLGGAHQPDFILLGPSIASGWPCAALLAFGEHSGQAPEGVQAPGLAARAMALATLRRLAKDPIHASLSEIGETLRSALQESCTREKLQISLAGPPAAMSFVCQSQENAEAALIAQHLQLELRAQGLVSEGDLLPWLGMQGDALATVLRGIDAALARIRTLLIEHNSYLSGGIPFVFPDSDPRLRERGIARYRYPRMADTSVEAQGDKLSIRFGAGEMGEVTSSGFYLPTLLRGDLDLQLSYRLSSWDPGPDSACLALFLQNESSTARYYSQRMSSGGPDEAHRVLSSMNAVLSPHHPVAGMAGQFRLSRAGSTLRAWHRSEPKQDWLLLGEERDCCSEDLIVGAKIWSKVRAGELSAELSNLRIEAEIPEKQLPLLEARPDPRGTGIA
jgi:hypothetical protein